jgi:hypothetical protein
VKRATHVPSKNEKTSLAYWLTPAWPEGDLFAEIIGILAAELKAPVFEPHLSICVTSDTDAARDLVKQVFTRPIRLRIKGVSMSTALTKTLFVRFEGSAALDQLNAKLCRGTKGRQKTLRDPHVSLLYKSLPMSWKRELASTLWLPFTEVVFDSLKAVQCHAPMETPADVESWRVVATKKLRR